MRRRALRRAGVRPGRRRAGLRGLHDRLVARPSTSVTLVPAPRRRRFRWRAPRDHSPCTRRLRRGRRRAPPTLHRRPPVWTRCSALDVAVPQRFLAVALPPLRPAALCCAVVPPCFDEPPDPDFLPPRFDAPGEFAILAARSFDIPFFFNASYCSGFFTLARLDGISVPPS